MKTRVLLAAAAGALMLAGCGAGPNAQTALTLPSIAGVSADAGDVAIRNATVDFATAGYPAGGEAPVQFAIANNGREPVRLVELSSEGASSVTLEGAQPRDPAVPADSPAPASPTPPGGGAATDLTIEPGALFAVTLRLTGLVEPLDGTNAVPVTLTFDNGASASMMVPMATPAQAPPREAPVDEGEEH